MASIAMNVPDRQVSIGRVFGRAFGTIGSNPVTTLGIAFLFFALPQTLFNQLTRMMGVSQGDKLGPAATVGLALVGMMVGVALNAIVQGAIVRSTIDYDEGRRAGLGESVMAGLVVALPLIVLAVIVTIGTMLGTVLLIVPGVILYLMWSVSVPALVDERLSIKGALGRSRFLTRGYRWRIFGMEAVLYVLAWLAAAIVALATSATVGATFQALADAAKQPPTILSIVVMLVVHTLTSVVFGVSHASLFVELRNAKDGPSDAALADVFR